MKKDRVYLSNIEMLKAFKNVEMTNRMQGLSIGLRNP